jgi:hypothetical protein
MGPCPCQWSGSSPRRSGAPPRRRHRGRQSCCQESRRGRAPTAGWQGEPVFVDCAMLFDRLVVDFFTWKSTRIKIRSSGRGATHAKRAKKSEGCEIIEPHVICINNQLVIQPTSENAIYPTLCKGTKQEKEQSQLTSNSALDSKKRSRSWVSTKKTMPLTSAK